MTLTKLDIETIALTILKELQNKGMAGDVCLYYNNKCICTNDTGDVTEYMGNVHPIDYCSYASENNILTISSEGLLYDYYNSKYDMPYQISKYVSELGLYFECNETWNWSLYAVDDRYDSIEYDTKLKPKDEFIYSGKENIPSELQMIMDCWYKASEQTGDIGYCVIGAGMNFLYKGKNYKMAPSSPYQGEGSWTKWVPMIKEMLKAIGATNITWNCGRLD